MTDELVVINEGQLEALIGTEGGTDQILEKLRNKAAAYEADISTEKGRKDLKSFAFKFTKTKTGLVKSGEDLIAKDKLRIKTISKEIKRYEDEVDKIKTEVLSPLTKWEAIDKARVDKIETEIKALRGFEVRDHETSESALEALESLEKYVIEGPVDRFFQEFTDKAISIHKRGMTILKSKYIILKKEEDDAAEAAKAEADRVEQERIDREAKVAEQAAEKAREEEKEAARLETERKDKIARDAINKVLRDGAEKERLAKEAADKVLDDSIAIEIDAEWKRQETEQVAKDAVAKAESEKIAAKLLAAKAIKDKKDAAKEAEQDKADAIQAEKDRQAKEVADKQYAEEQRSKDLIARKNMVESLVSDINNALLDSRYEGLQSTEKIAEAIIAGDIRHVKVAF